MAARLVIVYWPDFSGRQGAGVSFAAPLLASRLKRHLSARAAHSTAFVVHPEPDDPELASFRARGIRVLPGELDPERLVQLVEEYADSSHVALAMDPARGREPAELLLRAGHTAELWVPGAQAPGQLPVPGRPIRDVLHLRTSHPVGLFVDGRCLEGFQRRPGDWAWLGRALHGAASLVGDVVQERVYGITDAHAAWSLLTGDPTDPEPDVLAASEEAGEPLELCSDLAALADRPDAPQTWIVVSVAPGLPELFRRAHERGIRVLLWTPDDEPVDAATRAEADGWFRLSAVLAVGEGSRDRLLSRASRGVRGEPPVSRPGEVPRAQPEDPITSSARLGPWVRLVYHTECMLRQNGWSRIAYRKLAGLLAELDEFGPTPANAMLWINRARSEGILLAEAEPHRANPANRLTLCRPNPEHPLVRASLDVPDRCLRLLHQMLQKIPWVSFKLLRSVLMRGQWLGGSPYHLDEDGIDEWLNFLIQDGAIRMTKEPNLVNPDYPVTALRLNEAHPLARNLVSDVGDNTRLGAERAILAVDHFLTRNRKPWMAMGALRRALEGMGRDELQAVLQGLQNLGALVTESYPNPQKEHSTTGCRLKADEQIVMEALGTRDAIIRVTQYHQRYRSWVPLARVDEDLNTQYGPPPSRSHRLAWFQLLRDEGILELDHEGLLPSSAWETIRCRLNVTDAVVRAVVAARTEACAEVHVHQVEGPAAELSHAETDLHVRVSQVDPPSMPLAG